MLLHQLRHLLILYICTCTSHQSLHQIGRKVLIRAERSAEQPFPLHSSAHAKYSFSQALSHTSHRATGEQEEAVHCNFVERQWLSLGGVGVRRVLRLHCDPLGSAIRSHWVRAQYTHHPQIRITLVGSSRCLILIYNH